MHSGSSASGKSSAEGLHVFLFVILWIMLALATLLVGFLGILSFSELGTGEAFMPFWNLSCVVALIYSMVKATRLQVRRNQGDPVTRTLVWQYLLGWPLLILFIWLGGCAFNAPRLAG